MPKTKEVPQKHSLASLFDKLHVDHDLKNDAALARALDVAPPDISKARRGRVAIGAALILRLHEAFDIPVADIRAHMVEMPA